MVFSSKNWKSDNLFIDHMDHLFLCIKFVKSLKLNMHENH